MIDPVAVALIRQQLVSLNAYAEELRPFVSVNLAEYRARTGYRRAAERLIQLVIECAIDCAEKVIEACGKPPSPTARAAFQELELLGVVDNDMANLFSTRYVGLRNRIVHDYAEIDDGQVLKSGKRLVEDSPRFTRSISAWVDAQQQPAGTPGNDAPPSAEG